MKRCMKKSFLKTALLCVLACGMLFSCACKKAEEQTESAPIVLPTPTPAPQAIQGGELRLPMPANVQINDPFNVTTEEMLGFYSLIYESLVRLDNAGKLTACLAEHWESDTAGRVWTFKLRQARWHDDAAERLKAADVVFSYEKIVSYGEACYFAYSVSGIESMEAVDDDTLRITMKQAGIPSLFVLDFPIVRADYDLMPGARAIGTGPYKVDQIANTSVSLIVNENWWKQTPYIQRVSFFERGSNDTALASYAAGQLNMVATSNVAVGKYRAEGETVVTDVMTDAVELLLVNHRNQDLADVRIRQAIAYALDRSAIITNVYMNRAQASDVPIPPDSWLYESKSKVYDYDPVMAAQLLSETGWTDVDEDGVLDREGAFTDTFSLRLLVCTGSETVRSTAADMIAEQLGALGVVVDVVPAQYSLSDPECEFMQKLNAGDYDLALMGVRFGRNGDIGALINATGKLNKGQYADAAMEHLLANLFRASDEAAYLSAASAMQLQFVEELPCIVLYYRFNSIIHAAELQGMETLREPYIFRNIEKWYMYTN